MRAVKNSKSPPPIMDTQPRTTGPGACPQKWWSTGGRERLPFQLKGSRLLRALPLMLALTTIMFLVFSAVFNQPMRGEAPPRIARSSGFHYQYHMARVEDLVPAVLRGAAHLEKQGRAKPEEVAVHLDFQPVMDIQPVTNQVPPPLTGPSDVASSVGVEAEDAGMLPSQGHDMSTDERRAHGRVLIFTMDSISAYEDRSRKGGAAGELTIRRSLEEGLRSMGLQVDVARSDDEFSAKGTQDGGMAHYDVIVLDAWTWAAPGWEPKPFLRGHEGRIFLLDFFGAPTPTKNGIKVPPHRILTAFDTTPWNTFLGYFMEESPASPVTKKNQGVIWGKDPKHYRGRDRVLRAVADKVDLYSTLGEAVVPHPRIKYIGHQTPEGWRTLLSESKFLLGLGDPLLGPSAIDAISVGCVYINPVYDKPVKEIYNSQHPYAEHHIGQPYVCTTRLDDVAALQSCVEKAMEVDLPPMIPPQLTRHAYMTRLWEIFGPWVTEQAPGSGDGDALPA